MGLCSAAHGVVRREGDVLAHPATVALSGRSVVITSPMMTDATGHHPVITDEMVPHKRVMRASYWLRGSVAHARVAVPDAGLVHLARCVAVAGSESAAPHSLPAGVLLAPPHSIPGEKRPGLGIMGQGQRLRGHGPGRWVASMGSWTRRLGPEPLMR